MFEEQEFTDALRETIEEHFYQIDDVERAAAKCRVSPFAEPARQGLIVHCEDGSVFMVTVRQIPAVRS